MHWVCHLASTMPLSLWLTLIQVISLGKQGYPDSMSQENYWGYQYVENSYGGPRKKDWFETLKGRSDTEFVVNPRTRRAEKANVIIVAYSRNEHDSSFTLMILCFDFAIEMLCDPSFLF
mmetsp:Transcript_19869/g.29180  ORF Transcript_19869/g.29180 Transcript_19869/m.29180 type:complete len:119 (-) Transcript_19869:47-403(-)